MLCCGPAMRSLLIICVCCMSFGYVHRDKFLQNKLLLFLILYFQRMTYYNISILEEFCLTFGELLL